MSTNPAILSLESSKWWGSRVPRGQWQHPWWGCGGCGSSILRGETGSHCHCWWRLSYLEKVGVRGRCYMHKLIQTTKYLLTPIYSLFKRPISLKCFRKFLHTIMTSFMTWNRINRLKWSKTVEYMNLQTWMYKVVLHEEYKEKLIQRKK